MFGLFGKSSFEQEMSQYEEEAKILGRKYSPDRIFGATNNIFEQMEIQQKMMMETMQINLKRIDCCRRHGKVSEQRKWEDLNAKIRNSIG